MQRYRAGNHTTTASPHGNRSIDEDLADKATRPNESGRATQANSGMCIQAKAIDEGHLQSVAGDVFSPCEILFDIAVKMQWNTVRLAVLLPGTCILTPFITCHGGSRRRYKTNDTQHLEIWRLPSILECNFRGWAKMNPPGDTHGSALILFEDADCVEVYLYRRKPSSIRSTARLFLEQSLALGKFDLDFPFHHLALRVGDHYYEATTKGLSLNYRHYHRRDRDQYDWLPDSNYSRSLLGCTNLSHEEIHERGMLRRRCA